MEVAAGADPHTTEHMMGAGWAGQAGNAMCGRFTQDVEGDELVDLYELDSFLPQVELRKRWNGAPTQIFAVCRTGLDGQRELAAQRWGLVPAWSRDAKIGARLINARSETVDSKPAFRGAFRQRRCLVPANGWFEWQNDGSRKQPWWISRGGELFSFAGLWDSWDRGDGRIDSFTVVTCRASPSMQWLHHRQPAIIPRDRYREWLDPATRRPELLALVQTALPGPFDCRRVGPEVNNARNDYPELLAAV